MVVATIAAALTVASVLLPVLVYSRARQTQQRLEEFATSAVVTEAEIVRVTRRGGEDGRALVTYRFLAGAETRTAETSVRSREAHLFPVGTRVPVRYLTTDPAQSWLGGQRPRSTPISLVFVIPPALWALAGTLLLLIRRQTGLLRYGRAALATVTKTEKLRGRDTTTWRVYYEWRVLSGARRTSRYDLHKKTPPSPGTPITIVYDRDHTQRHARYPLSLARVTRR
jgi:hypothetical protein